MKKWLQITWFFLFGIFQILGQQNKKYQFDFSLLRQYDLIEISKEDKTGFYKNVKQINLGSSGILSFGGSYRTQAESFINEEFSSALEQSDIW
ncbi:MAG: hypothetical protein AAGC43_17820, partial [Bacteroidota bacterium]